MWLSKTQLRSVLNDVLAQHIIILYCVDFLLQWWPSGIDDLKYGKCSATARIGPDIWVSGGPSMSPSAG